jgi:hypothetical protein
MVSNIAEQNYSCFLHPKRTHNEYPNRCPDCGLPYDFPLTNPPKQIAGRIVTKGLSRGFYGAVFQAKHLYIANRDSAIKVIPKATYAPIAQGGYGKDFHTETELYHLLSQIDLVAMLYDANETDVTFGEHTISCYWLEMEYVRGPLLKEIIERGPENPRIIAQIAYDLLDLIGQLQQRSKYHNDLHGGNVKVVFLDREYERRNAIAPNVQTKILDLGSVADESKSGSSRWGDIHQVANQIIELIESYERRSNKVEPRDQRICARLHQIAQQWCAIDDESRRPKPQDLISSLKSAYDYGEEWWKQSVKLESIAADINAVTMPSHRAQVLFQGPDRWRDSLLEPGTKLLTGMRGCGKTMLLRSFHWQARIFQYDDESKENVLERIKNDTFLALFVSCATLLRGPRPTHTPELVMHRLFLAFALEVIHFVQTCNLRKIGNFDQSAYDRLNLLIKKTVDWYNPPIDSTDLYAIENALNNTVNNIPAKTKDITDFNPRQAFEDLTKITRSFGDIVSNKHLDFLLDDVSIRYMSKESVETILRQLCFQSGLFSFKVSTETQTLALHSPGGMIAQIGRDYEIFDLGEEVFAILRDKRERISFIENILSKRTLNTTGMQLYQQCLPSQLLGRKSLINIARNIRSEGKIKINGNIKVRGKKPKSKVITKFMYYGIDALVGICVGDLGEIITIYDRMLRHANPSTNRVDNIQQNIVLIDFAEGRLRRLATIDPWLYSHAIAFAQASHRELLSSRASRLRQYAEVDVSIGIKEANILFPKIIELIDQGVFVATGATSRMKSKEANLQFKLAFRKLLGLTNRIPLSMRDRFELDNSKLKSWLETPDSKILQTQKKAKGNQVITEEDEDEDDNDKIRPEPRQVDMFNDIGPVSINIINKGNLIVKNDLPHVLYDIESNEITDNQLSSILNRAFVIGAIGFEDRCLGSWKHLINLCSPASTLLLRYEDPANINAKNELRLINLLDQSGIATKILDTESIPDDAFLNQLISDTPLEHPLVIDVTSMTKPLIYKLLSLILRSRNHVYVRHSSAGRYFPNDTQLKPFVRILGSKLSDSDKPTSLQKTLEKLDQMATGSSGPYECVRIGETYSDPSQPVFLAALISLKLEPILAVLQQGEVEKSAIIYPEHTAGKNACRSIVGEQLAEFLAQLHHGEKIPVGSLDHMSAYRKLANLHRQWALEASYNYELSLTGTKMHTVGAAMFASIVLPSAVYYAKAASFNTGKFTKGTGKSRIMSLKRVERITGSN